MSLLLSESPGGQPEFGWSIVASAGSLSAVAGVLAGFVFAAIVAMLTTPPRRADLTPAPPTSALSVLFGAFFSLVVAAVLFAVLAGSGANIQQYRPWVEGYCLIWILCLGVVQLAAGIRWLLSDYGVDAEMRVIGRALIVAAIAISAIAVAGVLTQPAYVHHSQHVVRDGLLWLGNAAIIVASIFVRRKRVTDLADVTLVAIVAVVLMAVAYGVTSSLMDAWVKTAYHTPLGLAAAAVSAVVLSFLFGGYLKGSPPRSSGSKASSDPAPPAPPA